MGNILPVTRWGVTFRREGVSGSMMEVTYMICRYEVEEIVIA